MNGKAAKIILIVFTQESHYINWYRIKALTQGLRSMMEVVQMRVASLFRIFRSVQIDLYTNEFLLTGKNTQ